MENIPKLYQIDFRVFERMEEVEEEKGGIYGVSVQTSIESEMIASGSPNRVAKLFDLTLALFWYL